MPVLKEFTEDDIPTLLLKLRDVDSRFLIQLAGKGYKYPLTSKQILQNVEDKNHLLFKFVSDSDEVVLGYCQITKINWKDRCGSIGRVLVNEEYRGQGLSYLMLEQLIQYVNQELKFEKLVLRVFDFNTPAKKCYVKLGFSDIKTEEVYFEEIGESWNCITMEKHLR